MILKDNSLANLYNLFFNNKYIRIDPSKNPKFIYYIKNLYLYFRSKEYFQKKYNDLLKDLNKNDSYEEIIKRVNYYNKLSCTFSLKNYTTIKEFQKVKKNTYFFDLNRYLRYFNHDQKFSYLFGDITYIPNEPSFVKSRPIIDQNNNSILTKLNYIRHFIFLDDKIPFERKKNILVWRGKAHQKHRQEFLTKFYNHPLCDVGQIVKKKDKGEVLWKKEKLSLKQHLNYKFILAIEGNDVASNLKWIMSSNSLAFMVKPKYETWFMEGSLKPDYHYVLLKDDYSDLEEKIKYYSTHIDEAQEIINNAHKYISQFKDHNKEDIISLLVLKKYFEKII